MGYKAELSQILPDPVVFNREAREEKVREGGAEGCVLKSQDTFFDSHSE